MDGKAIGRRIRKWWWRPGGLLVLGLALAAGASAQEAVLIDPPSHCQSDALGHLWCADEQLGTAVVDTLGRVGCAPGRCARDDHGDWFCAREAGGTAGWSPEAGAVCHGGCIAPSRDACERL